MGQMKTWMWFVSLFLVSYFVFNLIPWQYIPCQIHSVVIIPPGSSFEEETARRPPVPKLCSFAEWTGFQKWVGGGVSFESKGDIFGWLTVLNITLISACITIIANIKKPLKSLPAQTVHNLR